MVVDLMYDRIVVVLNEVSDGGATKSTLDLLNNIPAVGGRPSFFYSGESHFLYGGEPPGPLREDSVQDCAVIPLPRPWRKYRHTALSFFTRAVGKAESLYTPASILSKKYDALFRDRARGGVKLAYFCKDPLTDIYTIYSAIRFGLQTVCHIRAVTPAGIGRGRRRFLNRNVGLFVANSEYTKNEWVKAGIEEEKIEVVYNACPKVSAAGREREQYSAGGDREILIGTIGRLVSWKRQRDLLSALAKLKTLANERVSAIFAGEGEMRSSLEASAVQLGISDQVRFFGYRNDILSLMAGLDIVVIPSDKEPFGRTAIEAMTLGIPVIGAASGGLPEIIIHGHNGLLYPTGNTDQLARQLAQLINHPEYRRALGKNAREDVNKRFTIDQYVNNMTEAFRKVMR